MRLITYRDMGYEMIGMLSEDGKTVYPMNETECSFFNMNDLIARITKEEMEALRRFLKQPTGGIPIDSVEKCSPIPRPAQDVICLGINYREHAVEAERFHKEAFLKPADDAIFFSKRVNEAVPDGGVVNGHFSLDTRIDYECELAVIIGREACCVKAGDAYEYVFGYTILNDVSARSLQTSHKQWYFGKSLDGFTPIGPCIVTADEIPGIPDLSIQSFVNGEIRQNSRTNRLIHDIGEIIETLSAGMTLLPGTIIATGTPSGVGMGMQPPCFLKSGDVVECRIEKIGSLTNTFI